MWKDDNDRIMNILDNIEKKDKERFPIICPICGKRDGQRNIVPMRMERIR